MPIEIPELEVESYLRLNHASHEEWLAGVRVLLGCGDVGCRVAGNQTTVGALSALKCEGGHIVCAYTRQAVEISGCKAEGPFMVVPVGGQVEASRQNCSWMRLDQLLIVRPGDNFCLRLGEKSQAIFLRPAPGVIWSEFGDYGNWSFANLRRLVDIYLFRSRFFLDDHHARTLSTDLFRRLGAFREVGERKNVQECPKLDRRLLLVLEKFQQEPEWEFDLKELAAHSGVSERNLYYLMKRETGMTPYRLFQRCRLLRVRRRLVDCSCDFPHISTYAADEGFSHLGRFASLYREHFGELPSETVQWRRSLLTEVSTVPG